MMTERDHILGRVREALRIAAPKPGHHPAHRVTSHSHVGVGNSRVATEARRWLPAVGESMEDRIALLKANALDLKAEFHLIEDEAQFEIQFRKVAADSGWKRVASHPGELTARACQAIGLPVLWTDAPYDVGQLESADAGITGCDSIVVQTGSVLLSSRSAGGRALSVLPPHHVVVARRDQIVPDLPAAFERLQALYAENYPSFISFVTGPSRTGDIERILVLGAHGPKRLTIFCL